MKICLITSVHTAFDVRIFYKEAKTLASAGYDVVLIAPGENNKIIEGIRINALPHIRNRLLRMLMTAVVFYKALKEKADFYHLHDPELLPIGLLLKLSTGKPVLYDVHEYYADSMVYKYWIPRPLRKIIGILTEFIEKRISSHLSGIITVNDQMATLFLKYNPRVISLYNYPTLELFGRLKRKPKGKKDNAERVIIYVGGISKSRGLETILEVMPEVIKGYPKVRCLLVGEVSYEGLACKYRNNLEDYLQQGNIEPIGRVDHEEIPRLLGESDIGWLPLLPLPNYQRATPLKLIEYMAMAIPVVASNIGVTAQIVKETGCGMLVEPNDTKDHERAIIYLLKHPAESKRMGQRGRRAFLRKYNWKEEGKKLVNFYRKIWGEFGDERNRKD